MSVDADVLLAGRVAEVLPRGLITIAPAETAAYAAPAPLQAPTGFAAPFTDARLRRRLLRMAAADCAGALTAAIVAVAFSATGGAATQVVRPVWVLAASVQALIWVALLAMTGAYNEWSVRGVRPSIRPVVNAALWVAALIVSWSWVSGADLSQTPFRLGAVLTVAASLTFHTLGSLTLRLRSRAEPTQRRCLVVGCASEVPALREHLERTPRSGLRVVGVRVDDGDALALADLLAEVGSMNADTVLVAGGGALADGRLRSLAWALQGTGVRLLVAPPVATLAGPRLRVRGVGGLPIVEVREPERAGPHAFMKEAFDRSVAALVTVAIAPLLLSIAMAVRCSGRGPVLFRQTRVGRHGRSFSMLKFRTMYDGADRDQERVAHLNECNQVLFKIRRDPRITPVGRLLRRFSLDELPQLLNVIGGSMSLVGPRPPLPSEVAMYPEDARRRLLIKPGITGPWQVSGRSDLTWDDMVRLDLHYIDHRSMGMDVRLLLQTVLAVVSGRGAY